METGYDLFLRDSFFSKDLDQGVPLYKKVFELLFFHLALNCSHTILGHSATLQFLFNALATAITVLGNVKLLDDVRLPYGFQDRNCDFVFAAAEYVADPITDLYVVFLFYLCLKYSWGRDDLDFITMCHSFRSVGIRISFWNFGKSYRRITFKLPFL